MGSSRPHFTQQIRRWRVVPRTRLHARRSNLSVSADCPSRGARAGKVHIVFTSACHSQARRDCSPRRMPLCGPQALHEAKHTHSPTPSARLAGITTMMAHVPRAARADARRDIYSQSDSRVRSPYLKAAGTPTMRDCFAAPHARVRAMASPPRPRHARPPDVVPPRRRARNDKKGAPPSYAAPGPHPLPPGSIAPPE